MSNPPNLPNLEDTPGIRKNASSVRKARARLQEEADKILKDFQSMIGMACAQGEYEAALKAQQWLLEHVPDEEGQRVIGPSVDKTQVIDTGPKGPLIQIGIMQSGVGKLTEAPAITIEATPVDTDE